MRLAVVVVGLLALAGCPSRQAEQPPVAPALPPVDGARLAGALRQGGFVLFVRHAATDRSREDAGRVVLEDCGTQRVLSARGRAEAESIAAAFARLRVPVGEVRSSPYCRCADTARLAFGYLLLDGDLGPLRDGNAAQRLAALRRLLGTPPVPGTNAVLVGHGDGFEKLTGIELAEGEAAVVRPAAGGGSFTVVTRVRAEQWASLGAAR